MYLSLLHVDRACDDVLVLTPRGWSVRRSTCPYSTWMESVTVYLSLLHVDRACDGVLVAAPCLNATLMIQLPQNYSALDPPPFHNRCKKEFAVAEAIELDTVPLSTNI